MILQDQSDPTLAKSIDVAAGGDYLQSGHFPDSLNRVGHILQVVSVDGDLRARFTPGRQM